MIHPGSANSNYRYKYLSILKRESGDNESKCLGSKMKNVSQIVGGEGDFLKDNI